MSRSKPRQPGKVSKAGTGVNVERQGGAVQRERRAALLAQLCTVHVFDPAAVDGFTATECTEALALDTDSVTWKDRPLLALRTESRLEGLQGHDSADAALRACVPGPLVDTPLQRVLTAMLEWSARGAHGAAPSLPVRDGADEIGRVLYWFERVPWAQEFARRVRGDLWRQERRAMLEKIGGKQFVGREYELRKLREFVGGKKGTMALDAVGGMGKTALLAHFELEQTPRTLVVAVDLDDSQIDIRAPNSLFAAIFRVLARYIPDFQSPAELLTEYAFKTLESVGESVRQRGILESIIEQGRAMLRRARGDMFDSIILIIDTFERAIRLGEAESLAALPLVDELFGSVKAHTIMAGRGVSNLPFKQSRPPLSLRELEVPEARQLLRNLDVHPDVIESLLTIVPRRPLTLRLVARLDEVKTGTVDVKRLEDAVRRQLVDGYLHLRVLDHLFDKRVAALFHVGVALRRITPELILALLAEVPAPKVADLPDAIQLFEKLRQISDLVKEGGATNELVLREEVRGELLGLVSDDERDRVMALRRRCVAYFKTRDIREAAFHTLMLAPGAVHTAADADVAKRTERELHALVEGKPERVDTRLMRRIGSLVDKEAFAEADDVLASIENPTPEVLALHATMLRRLGKVDEAAAKADATHQSQNTEVRLEVARVRAWVAARRNQAKQLDRALEDAARLLEELGTHEPPRLTAWIDLATQAVGSRFQVRFREAVADTLERASAGFLIENRRLLLAGAAISGRRQHLQQALRLDALSDIDDVPRAGLHALIYEPFSALRARHGEKEIDSFGLTDPPVRTALVVKSLSTLIQQPWPEAVELVRRVVAEAYRVSETSVEERSGARLTAIHDLGAWVEVSVPPFMRREMAQRMGGSIGDAFDRSSLSGDGLVSAADRGRAILGLFQQLLEISRPIEELEPLFRLRRQIAVPPAFEHKPHTELLVRWRQLVGDETRDLAKLLDQWGLPWLRRWSALPAVRLMEAIEVLNQRAEVALPPELASNVGADPSPLKGHTGTTKPPKPGSRDSDLAAVRPLGAGDRTTIIDVVLQAERRHLTAVVEDISPGLGPKPADPLFTAVSTVVDRALAEGWTGKLLDELAQLQPVLRGPINALIASTRRSSWQPTTRDPFEEVLLEDRQVFIGREPLRTHLRVLTSTAGQAVLLIDGPPNSGKSASVRFIQFAAGRRGFDVHVFRWSAAFSTIESVARSVLQLVHSTERLPGPASMSPAKYVAAVAKTCARAFRNERPTVLIFDECNHASTDVQAFVSELAIEIDRTASETLRTVIIGVPDKIPPLLVRVALRETIQPITTADVVRAAMQVARARSWRLTELEAIAALEISNQTPEDRAGLLQDYLEHLANRVGLDAAAGPKLVARFSLGPKGKPRREKFTKQGKTHYEVVLQIDDAAPGTQRVVYRLDETFEDRTRRVTQAPRYLELIWTYGDFDVHATLVAAGKSETKLARPLVEMLRDGHLLDMNPEIEKAITVLRNNS